MNKLIQKVGTTTIMSKSLKTIRLSLIFQTCFDGTSVIVSVTVKITSVWLHNIAIAILCNQTLVILTVTQTMTDVPSKHVWKIKESRIVFNE